MSSKPGLFQIIRNSLWNPQFRDRITYEQWLLSGDGGSYLGATESGEGVSEERGSRETTVFNCINLLAQDVAQTPFKVHKGTDVAKIHPAHRLVSLKPNNKMSAYAYWYSQVFLYLTWGNSYSIIIRDGNRMPSMLLPLEPSKVRIVESGNMCWAEVHGLNFPIPYEDILHFKLYTRDGLNGISPILYNAETIGYKIKQTKYSARSLGSVPPMYFSGEANDDQQKQIVKAWKENIHGSRVHGVPFLVGDIKANKLQIPPNELQYIETKIETNKEIFGIYRVNPTLISNFDQGVQANAEQQALNHVKFTLQPHFQMIEQECNIKLFPERTEYFTKHNVNGFLRGDTQTRKEYYQFMRTGGIMNADEIRALEDMGPQEGTKGKKYFIQGAMMDVEDGEKELQNGN